MRVVGTIAALLLIAASAVPASAVNWSIGANLGANVILPEDTDVDGDGIKDNLQNTTEFAWPHSGLTPGLRVGFTGANPQHEFYFDTGLFMSSTKDGISTSDFSASANYQYNFGSSGSVAPYFTVGAGLLFDRFKNDTPPPPSVELSATSGIFGGGLGIRHKMGNGHGTLRAEVRYDRITEGKDQNIPIIIESNIVGFKLGFDLWDNGTK